jgi:hypothetical protein
MAPFYDNNTKDIPPIGEFQRVDWVYTLRFSDFTAAHWERLDKIYRSLPEFGEYPIFKV